MAAPWGAIIQAIDHAMGRMKHGAEAGVRVAGSQRGGSAQNTVTGAGTATGGGGGKPIDEKDTSQSQMQTPDTENQVQEAQEAQAQEMPETSGEGQEGNSEIGANVSETGEAAGESGGAGGMPDIGSMGGSAGGESAGAGEAAGGASAAGGIGGGIGGAGASGSGASGAGAGMGAGAAGGAGAGAGAAGAAEGAAAKGAGKGGGAAGVWGAIREWAINAGKGVSNAGAIATGNKAVYSDNGKNENKGIQSLGSGTPGGTGSNKATGDEALSAGKDMSMAVGGGTEEIGKDAGGGKTLSDANTKNSTNISSETDENTKGNGKAGAIMSGAKKWAEGASKGFANAGAIATGNKAAYTYAAQDTGEATNSIDQQKAKEWAEKVWENRRNKKEDASKTSDK